MLGHGYGAFLGAERENEIHKGWNSGTNGCEVTKERKEGKQNNMKGAQSAIKIIDSNAKSFTKIPSASEFMHRKKSVKANMPQE